MTKYQIIDKRLLSGNSILCFDKSNKEWFWMDINISDMVPNDVRFFHTKTQLIQSGFEEVFENPNYEAEEVTE